MFKNTQDICISITLLFLLFTLLGCSDNENKDLDIPIRQVRTITVDNGTGIIERSFSGTLQSSQETSLSFKVSGTIQEIFVEVGDKIKKDDVLAVLDDSPYSLEVQKAQASLTEAQSEYRNARADYERTKKLYIAGNSSRNDLDNARASSETAGASVLSAKKALEIAELDFSYTKLVAENDCSIALIDVDQGENIQLGSQVLFATCGDQLEVDIDIPESIITRIEKDMPVSVTFPAIPNSLFNGRVFEVGVTSVQGGTTYPVTILLETNSDSLISGLSADVVFALDSNKNGRELVPILPAFAVAEDQSGRFVFKVEIENGNRAKVRRTPVKIGAIHQDGIEILEGIIPGNVIVIAGVSVLRDGMEVKLSQ